MKAEKKLDESLLEKCRHSSMAITIDFHKCHAGESLTACVHFSAVCILIAQATVAKIEFHLHSCARKQENKR